MTVMESDDGGVSDSEGECDQDSEVEWVITRESE